jgi:hypothetical protein
MAILSVPIVLDKPRNLRFGMEAMIAIEDETGRCFPEVYRDLLVGAKTGKFSIKDFRNLIWAGLKHEDENLTPKQVSEILDNSDFEDLLGKIAQAVEGAIGEQGNPKAGATKKAEAKSTPA